MGAAERGNGHWYRLVRHGAFLCWSDAEQLARAAGGHLVSETSAADHDFVASRLVAPPRAWSGRWGPWIGAVQNGGAWSWTTGEPWGFTAWFPNEPNGGGGEPVVSYIAGRQGGGCGQTTLWNDYVNCGQPNTAGCDVGVWN
jgi:hypothetical protein